MVNFARVRRTLKCSHSSTMLRFHRLASHKISSIIDDFLVGKKVLIGKFCTSLRSPNCSHTPKYAPHLSPCDAQNFLNHRRFLVQVVLIGKFCTNLRIASFSHTPKYAPHLSPCDAQNFLNHRQFGKMLNFSNETLQK